MKKSVILLIAVLSVAIYSIFTISGKVKENVLETNAIANELNNPVIETCYGLYLEAIDANEAKVMFDFYRKDCKQTFPVYIKIGDVEKIYTTEEFFTLLGFDMNEISDKGN